MKKNIENLETAKAGFLILKELKPLRDALTNALLIETNLKCIKNLPVTSIQSTSHIAFSRPSGGM